MATDDEDSNLQDDGNESSDNPPLGLPVLPHLQLLLLKEIHLGNLRGHFNASASGCDPLIFLLEASARSWCTCEGVAPNKTMIQQKNLSCVAGISG